MVLFSPREGGAASAPPTWEGEDPAAGGAWWGVADEEQPSLKVEGRGEAALSAVERQRQSNNCKERLYVLYE